MKKRLFIFLTSVIFLLPAQTALTAESADPPIIIAIPESVIIEVLAQTLPLTLDGDSERLEGTITIVGISGFRLDDNLIIGHIALTGQDLSLVTSVADQDIRLKLGNASVDFDCEAELRFDEARQTLYIKLVARGIEAEKALESGDIGQALLLFLNGREFPIALEDIHPIVAEAGDKVITIDTHVSDIRSAAGMLQVSLLPKITTTPKP